MRACGKEGQRGGGRREEAIGGRAGMGRSGTESREGHGSGNSKNLIAVSTVDSTQHPARRLLGVRETARGGEVDQLK